MSKCECKNPTGGGMNCPPQYVAVCVRDSDGECRGDCISIPESYSFPSDEFQVWLVEALSSLLIQKGMIISFDKNRFLSSFGPSFPKQSYDVKREYFQGIKGLSFSFEFSNPINPPSQQSKLVQ